MIPTDFLCPPLMHLPWRRFINTTSGTIPAHGCMRIVSTTNLDGELVYRCAKPNNTFQVHYRVNGPFPVAAGKEGICYSLSEGGLVLGSSGAQQGEEYGAQNNSWSLAANRPGFVIDGTFGSEGVMSATQRDVTTLIGKTPSAGIALGVSGSVTVWMGSAGSEEVTGYVISAYNRTEDIEGNWWVSLTRVNGSWYVAPLQCPTEAA